jgi:hypothetical protein
MTLVLPNVPADWSQETPKHPSTASFRLHALSTFASVDNRLLMSGEMALPCKNSGGGFYSIHRLPFTIHKRSANLARAKSDSPGDVKLLVPDANSPSNGTPRPPTTSSSDFEVLSRPCCGLRFNGLPIASRKMAFLPFACGEKKLVPNQIQVGAIFAPVVPPGYHSRRRLRQD